ncbi:MAG: PEP-CTERM sorting domain-containing protein [Snowella sp.]|nr:PEP-CTERM sorting domain-containing protein [Snowella sp.]
MNLKNLSLSLALSSLGVLAISSRAQAYRFNFLNMQSVSGGLFDFNFEFVTEGPGDSIAEGQELVITGFTGATALSTSPVTDNVSGVLPSSFGFLPTPGISPPSPNGTTASFTAQANVSLIPGNIRYQTFTIRAAGVPGNIVFPSFPGPNNPLDPTPIPEPLTIMGSLAALGVGTRCKKEFDKKQAAKVNKA